MGLLNGACDEIPKALVNSGNTPYNSTNGHIGIGSSNTAYNASQTDLLGGSKYRELFDGPPGVASSVMTVTATVAGGDANFAWEEFIVVNHATTGSGTALNRLVSSQGTKGSGAVWQVEVTLDFNVGS